MSLINYLKKGTKIKGLTYADLNAGGVVGNADGVVSKGIVNGSYTVDTRYFSKDVITFFRDDSGQNKVIILPYLAGATNSTLVGGVEVVSGPFSGCWMVLYTDWAGSLRCAHVDTAPDGHGRKPAEAQWEKMQYQELDRVKTPASDALIDFLKKTPRRNSEAFAIGVADPATKKIAVFSLWRDSKNGSEVWRVLGRDN